MKKILLPLLFAFLFTGCAMHDFKEFDKNVNTQKVVSDEEYKEETVFEWKITKNDRVEVTVFNQSSSGGKQLEQLLSNAGSNVQYQQRDGTEGILIGNRGSIGLPLIGEVEIVGLTEDEAADKLILEYKKYLRSPFVKVKILNQKLFVLGEVKNPGVVQVTHGTMTLFEALAKTGDLTDDAARTNIKVLRGDLRNPVVREIDLTDMSAIALSSMILRPNDVIYVQPRGMKAYNVAFNEQTPFFELITKMLLPFATFTVIKDGYSLHGQ